MRAAARPGRVAVHLVAGQDGAQDPRAGGLEDGVGRDGDVRAAAPAGPAGPERASKPLGR